MSQYVENKSTTLGEHFNSGVTYTDAMERAKEYGNAGELLSSMLSEYIFSDETIDASIFCLLCQIGGAAANASLDAGLYELVYECMESRLLPRLDRPQLNQEDAERWPVLGNKTDERLFNAFTFELDPKDYNWEYKNTGDFGTTQFSTVEQDHYDCPEQD
jgi:hypothetical protein